MGIPDATIVGFKQGRPTFFEQKDDGYSWVTFNVGGDLRQPTENLLVKFEQDDVGVYDAVGIRRRGDFSPPAPLQAGPENLYHQRLEDLFGILSE